MAQNLSAREILDKLVSFPTVSRDSNLDLVDWVEAYLASHGVTATRVYNEDRTKAGLFVNVGPEVPGGVVLSGHTDVVPVDGQDWDTDPFTVVEKDGKLYGRGCCDMKAFDAIALAAVPKALKAGLKRPLQIALSYDEEIGCTGAPPLIEAMRDTLPVADVAIIGEPSMMKVVTGHKGGTGVATHVHGFEVHSSILHRGVSAVMEAAKLVDWANKINAEEAAKTPEGSDALFDPPWTTPHVGRISGGTADNITAKDCTFNMMFRLVPSDDPDDWVDRYMEELDRVEAGMKAIRPEAWIEHEVFFALPGLKPEVDGAAEALTRRITGDNGTHVVSYGTEAGHFQRGGYSAVVCGPGNIEQAHQPNEWMSVAQFEAGVAFMDKLIDQLCL